MGRRKKILEQQEETKNFAASSSSEIVVDANKQKENYVSSKDDEIFSVVAKVRKRISKKKNQDLSKEELEAKKQKHQEKIAKKQEARLAKHIEQVNKKEQNETPTKKERFYVTNAKLLEQLYIWRDSNEEVELRTTPEELGKMILLIAKRLSNHSNFKNYPLQVKEDMISYACFKCIQGLRNYNFKFKNAFAYFTTACYNAFISTVSDYYKNINIKKELVKRSIEKLESTKELNSSKMLSKFVKEYFGEEIAKDYEEGGGSDGE